MLIRLLLIFRIVLLPQTFEMYTPFNLFCLSGVVGWMPDKNWIVFPPLQLDAISLSLACSCLRVNVCVWRLVRQYVCYFQGAGSNVIRCRKDGNWTGSFRLCPHSKGQCSLPQNLHYSLQYSCKRGHGIGLYAHVCYFGWKAIQFSYCWHHLSLFLLLTAFGKCAVILHFQFVLFIIILICS